MLLKELIARLEKEDPDTILKKGFYSPHSHRGSYEQLAFETLHKPTSIGDLLNISKHALGSKYDGYKGGRYLMSGNTEVYLAFYGSVGIELSVELLEYMIKDVVKPVKACEGECGDDLFHSQCDNSPFDELKAKGYIAEEVKTMIEHIKIYSPKEGDIILLKVNEQGCSLDNFKKLQNNIRQEMFPFFDELGIQVRLLLLNSNVYKDIEIVRKDDTKFQPLIIDDNLDNKPLPKEVFETVINTLERVTSTEQFGFEQALLLLKDGQKLYRKGWNGIEAGIDMFVYLVEDETIEGDHGHDIISLSPFFLFYHSNNNTYNIWIPSMWDIMATDWMVKE